MGRDDRAVRQEVREFLRRERAAGTWKPSVDSWLKGHSPAFSRRCAEAGFVGMTWPRRYGGGERHPWERFAANEELLAAGAPVAAHWVAENQCGPLLLHLGSASQKEQLLPRIARSELFVAAGLSEPDTGSDLASLRTTAKRVAGGWRVHGRKLWSSNAHRNHWLLALVRTAPRSVNRHEGLTQLFVDLAAPGVQVRPIPAMGEPAGFAEVLLDDVFVPDEMVVGEPGQGWAQVSMMLSFERSGPERYLSTFTLLRELLARPDLTEGIERELGELVARWWAVRALALRVQRLVEGGGDPQLQGAMGKAAGARVEQDVAEVGRLALATHPGIAPPALEAMVHQAQLVAPGFTIRGGSLQVLNNVIAKGLAREH
ncbi:MAG: acyl-CoA dehydrogenase family protein [Burkholderiaceae bacterium]|nr:acyl-CoA dehydrogenase family protein [Burkholderiaceae bacterium]